MNNEDVRRAMIAHFGAARAAELFAAMEANPPGHWMHEASGVLRPVIEAYLYGRVMNDAEISIMRRYLYQWMTRGTWDAPAELTDSIKDIRTREDLDGWLHKALDLGIDPL